MVEYVKWGYNETAGVHGRVFGEATKAHFKKQLLLFYARMGLLKRMFVLSKLNKYGRGGAEKGHKRCMECKGILHEEESLKHYLYECHSCAVAELREEIKEELKTALVIAPQVRHRGEENGDVIWKEEESNQVTHTATALMLGATVWIRREGSEDPVRWCMPNWKKSDIKSQKPTVEQKMALFIQDLMVHRKMVMTHEWGIEMEQESEEEDGREDPDLDSDLDTDTDSSGDEDADFQQFYNLEKQHQELQQAKAHNQGQDDEYSEDDDSGTRTRKDRRTI